MNPKQLQIVSKIQRELDSIKHPDSYRIAREIASYYRYNPVEIESAIQRILQNEPWEYIRGTAEFLGNGFKVTPNTLIPRIETEELVKHVISFVNENDNINRIVDVGTGSGVIICTLAIKLHGGVEYIGTDISESALKIATENTKTLRVDNKVKLVYTNLTQGVDINSNTVIVANLPYIPSSAYIKLDSSVKDYEPVTALEGGLDGLKYINEMITQISEAKEKPIAIFLEIDPSQGDYLKYSLENIRDTHFQVEIINDFMDRPRFIRAILAI